VTVEYRQGLREEVEEGRGGGGGEETVKGGTGEIIPAV